MIFPIGQMMTDKERGRLFSIQIDGSDSVPFIIKKDKLLIGRGDSCEIRIYVEGVSPEHCVITFSEEGRGFVEPLNKCGLTFLNGELIERQVSLEHNDVITIVKRSFRFFYPSSSKFFVAFKPVTTSEENIVEEHLDFEPEDVFTKRGKEIPERRVTFGPRLSPEEFDRNMPPASPIRKGSLPADKLKAKVPEKSHFKRALFNNSSVLSSPSIQAKRLSLGKQLPRSTVVLHQLRCASFENQIETNQSQNSTESRPLFSEVLKKSVLNPQKDTVANKTALQKYGSKKVAKKPIKLQNSKKTFYKSQRRPIHSRVLAVGSTGHVNSPETIVIYKKRIAPLRNSLSSVKKRKSLRLLGGSVSSQNSVSEKNEEHLKSSDSTAINEPVSNVHSDTFLDSPDPNNNPASVPENSSDISLYDVCDMSTHKQKSRRSCNEDDGSPIQEKDINEKQTSVSPLAVAIDSVAQLDENSIDKSLKDIHNAVQALACHSNVSPALSNEPSSSADMCMNAVKKLALTISMVNAFHMYRRIIDDVSGFPLCFPSTSFDSNKDNKCVQRSGAHQNDEPMDIARLSWFQDIMRNFFTNSVRNDVYDGGRKCMLRSCENDLCPEVTSMCNEQNINSQFTSKNKFELSAIDSGCKNPKCKSVCAQYEKDVEVFSRSDDVQQANILTNINECCCSECTPIRSSCCENCQRVSMTESNKDLNSEIPSRRSLPSEKDNCSYQPPLLLVQNSNCHVLSTTEDAKSQKARKSIASNSSFENLNQSVQETFNEKPKCSSVELKKPLTFKSPKVRKSCKVVRNRSVSRKTLDIKVRRAKKSQTEVLKPQKVSLVAKRHGIMNSKRIKEQKRIRQHRLSILKKVNFKVKSPKVEIEVPEETFKPPRTSRKRKGNGNALLITKHIRVSQKLVKQARSRASISPSVHHNAITSVSPKLLRKRNEKRKSVVFKSRGLRSKKSDLPVSSSIRRKSMVINTSSSMQFRRNVRRKKASISVDHDIDMEAEPSTKSRNSKKEIDVNVEASNIKKQKDRGTCSHVIDDDVNSTDIVNVDHDNDTETITRKTRKALKRNGKTANVKKQGGKRTRSLVNVENKIANSLDFKIVDHDNDTETITRKNQKDLKRNAKTSNVKKQGGKRTRSFVNDEKIVNSLDFKIDDQSDGSNIIFGKRTGRSAKEVSLTPIMETKTRNKFNAKVQVKNIDGSIVSVESKIAVENSQISDKELLKKADATTLTPKSKSSKMKAQKGKRKVNSSVKCDNQDNQIADEQTNKKIQKEQVLLDQALPPKKKARSSRKKIVAFPKFEEESNKFLEVQEIDAKTNKKIDGAVLKEVTKNTATRTLRSKKTRANTTNTETIEAVGKVSQKQNIGGKKRNKRDMHDTTNSEEESLQIIENDSENLSQNKRGKRKRANEISVKTEEKNSKQKSSRRKVNQDFSNTRKNAGALNDVVHAESTTVVDTRTKRRKISAGDENMPRSTPKRGKKKKSQEKIPKEKINQTEVPPRSLRSRKLN